MIDAFIFLFSIHYSILSFLIISNLSLNLQVYPPIGGD